MCGLGNKHTRCPANHTNIYRRRSLTCGTDILFYLILFYPSTHSYPNLSYPILPNPTLSLSYPVCPILLYPLYPILSALSYSTHSILSCLPYPTLPTLSYSVRPILLYPLYPILSHLT